MLSQSPASTSMAVQAKTLSLLGVPFRSTASQPGRRKSLKLSCKSNGDDSEQDYLIDAPVSVGDGFSFSGGKYSDGPSRSDEWFKEGKIVRAHRVLGSGEKAKDPIFGLKMGSGSQAPADTFRWFCVESGSADNPSVILIHGLPSQAYSYRKVLPILSKDYRAIAFDWLGFGFSDKPQPGYGFDYTLDEYASSLESLISELATGKVSIVVQGYFSPVVVKYALNHQEKLNDLILLNSPDPLRASDKALTSCGPYKMKEDDAMVYRRPYLTSGSSGFALNAISRAMKKELKTYVEDMQRILTDKNWKVPTTVLWGQRDRWLSYDGVEDFCKDANHKLVEVPTFKKCQCQSWVRSGLLETQDLLKKGYVLFVRNGKSIAIRPWDDPWRLPGFKPNPKDDPVDTY
ncbi:uncharacterized protein LOC122294252 isoform X2 [Carya illinoinensis]|uniref:uncharacterized protein LOC122294252 isoform X2 n=1 Tax=Carya illinoinensis TaxID=32201 RepID=UPI001C729AE0|nr:uncharacterized protein LOC122294252 isoform X2 [Carya illinoinensis]